MRSSLLFVATLLVALGGVAGTAQAGYHYGQQRVLQGQDGGSATGGPVGGLPDRN